MKIRNSFLSVFLILAATLAAHAQGVHYSGQVVGQQAIASSYATVAVCPAGTVGPPYPCANPVSIYDSSALTTTKPNPFFADSEGRFDFWIAAGHYVLLEYGYLQPPRYVDIYVSNGGSTLSCSSCTTNTLPKTTGSNSLGDSTVTDDGTNPVRSPDGLNTATGPIEQEYTAGASITAGLAVCATGSTDTNGRPEVSACSHTASQPGAGFAGIAEDSASSGATVRVCWTTNCSATFDNTSTALNEAILSTTTDGELHDTGAQTATAGQPNFTILAANTGGGSNSPISLTDMLAQNPKGGGGGGSSNYNFAATSPVTVATSGKKVTYACPTCSTSSGGSQDLLINNQSANYTIVVGDCSGSQNTEIRMDVSTANTVTIPINSSVACSIGSTIYIFQVGAGQTTVIAASGVTINTPTSLSLRAQNSMITLTQVSTNEWDLTGDAQ